MKPGFEELESTLEELVQGTNERREIFLDRFGKLFDSLQSERNIDFEGRKPTSSIRLDPYSEPDMEICTWLKKVYDRFPYEGGFVFTRDSRSGVVPTIPIDLKREYTQNFLAFIIMKYDSVAGVAAANDNWRKSKDAGIRHTLPWLFYEDRDSVYALVPFIIGPNLAETFQLLRQDSDKMRALKYIDEIVRVNNCVLLEWQQLHQKSVRTYHIRESQNEYLTNIRLALDYLRKKAVPQFTDSELEKFIYSLAGMKGIAPYDDASNATLFSRLMDNAEENSRLELGIVMPSLPVFYKKLSASEIDEEFQEIIRERYVLVDTDTSMRVSHIFEDLIHLNHAPGAELNAEQKISRFKDFVARKFEGKDFDASKLWLAYAMVGLYKSIRKQNRILEVYSQKSKEEVGIKLSISMRDYKTLLEDYFRKVQHWGREARRFAALGHLVASNFREGQSTFESLESLVRSTNMEDYIRRLNETPAPKLTEKSADAERMLAAYKFCDRYLSPQSINF